MLERNTIITLAVTCLSIYQVGGILSNKNGNAATPLKTPEKTEDIKKQDNIALQSFEREYGYSDNHIGGGYGSSGYGGGYDSYGGGYEGGKYHGYEDHKHHDPGYHKALAIKGLLVPLAGVALLGAAAAFVSNPILLQLGVISGTYAGRKRRDTNNNRNLEVDESIYRLEAQEKLSEIQLLERFMAQIPKEEMQSQEKKLLANYLSCSGMTSGNGCLERLACELHSSEGASMPVETDVMAIVTNEILTNDFIPDHTKIRISRAVQMGKNNEDCSAFRCEDLEKLMRKEK